MSILPTDLHNGAVVSDPAAFVPAEIVHREATDMLEPNDLVAVLRSTIDAVYQGSVANTAAALNVSPEYLHDVLRGRRHLTDRVAQKMGYDRVVTFRLRR